MGRVLLLTTAQILDLDEIQALRRGLALPAEAKVSVITRSDTLGQARIEGEDGSYDHIVSLSNVAGLHNAGVLGQILRVLRSGGSVWLQEPVASEGADGPVTNQSLRTAAQLSSTVLLSGFVGTTEESDPVPFPISDTWRSSSAENGVSSTANGPTVTTSSSQASRPQLLRATKPAWTSGAAFAIKAPTPSTAPIAPTVDAKAMWKIDMNGNDDDVDGLVDEDELLTEEDLQPAEADRGAPAGSDSGAEPERKACKNCSCGRAEGTVKLPLSEEQLNNPQSSCGNCGLGDAFRCAGCPYLGLPAFKLGEKIALSKTMLEADA